jgi:hypothetical protein
VPCTGARAYKTLIPDILSIQTTSHRAITATTMYLIHCPTVFGSVRLGIAHDMCLLGDWNCARLRHI